MSDLTLVEKTRKIRRKRLSSHFSDMEECVGELDKAIEDCDFTAFIDTYYNYWKTYGSIEEILRSEGMRPRLSYEETEETRRRLWEQYKPLSSIMSSADPVKIDYIKKCLPRVHVESWW